ncbi:hypothetical protein EDB84DRAFT_1678531 [Lactarius hengduanensis]|nr:hypothetical protein EDB84DRAFT_1678531 [Lactarius hengduanensis]
MVTETGKVQDSKFSHAPSPRVLGPPLLSKSSSGRTTAILPEEGSCTRLSCDTPAAILIILQEQVDRFEQSRSADERLHKWLDPTINVLYAFSQTLGEGIGLVFSPAKVIFAGAGVLLMAAMEVEASQDILIDIFERIENFFRRLEVYTQVPPTPAMTDMMVKIMVEVLDILGTATKEMKQSRARIRKLEDGLKKLDKMTNEEARMANAEVLKVAHDIDKKVDGVDEKVQGVGAGVKDVDEKVQGVDEKVQTIIDGQSTYIIDFEQSRRKGSRNGSEIDHAYDGAQDR